MVILDEATAYADPENEAKILDSFSRLITGRTVIVIAHRLSTITTADQILGWTADRSSNGGDTPAAGGGRRLPEDVGRIFTLQELGTEINDQEEYRMDEKGHVFRGIVGGAGYRRLAALFGMGDRY